MEINSFISAQLAAWPDVAARHDALRGVEVKEVPAFGRNFRVQFNPARAVSTAAKVDAASIAARPCFLCKHNRPEEQIEMDLGDFTLLVNPFPIFPNHLVIAAKEHTPQTLTGYADKMRRISKLLPGFTVIFNGAKSGASAPDHMHFQAVPSDYVTIPDWCFSYELPEGVEVEDDGMLNAYCRDGHIRIVPRRAHRPSCYGEVIVSPASLDLGGTLITVRKEDFDRMDSALLERILSDVIFLHPEVEVGICKSASPKIIRRGDGLTEVENVTIGVGFHWQRQQNQVFAGDVFLRNLADGEIQVVNRVDVEEYLRSVIGSEMSSTSFPELLKAHAVISRSWLFAQMRITRALTAKGNPVAEPTDDSGSLIRWYDRDDHQDFDVCADDHCQRYQGVSRTLTPQVDEAIAATCGLVLADADGRICDARFSKCCGGVTELFENCWQPRSHSYLAAVRDADGSGSPTDLSDEDAVRRWIMSEPESYCNTSEAEVLNQVLNDFDRDTTPDFYRWGVSYSPSELSELIHRRSGIDFGEVKALIPVHRGPSGRITRLKIMGTKTSVTVGKELEVRRWLSNSHLRSSSFVTDRDGDGNFIIRGAGWGHGVGLCQIGAAVMAWKGADFRTILSHYYPGTKLISLYS